MFLFGDDFYFIFHLPSFKKKDPTSTKGFWGWGGGGAGGGGGANPPNLIYFKEVFFEIVILKGGPRLNSNHS
jgi:hypothetical protein